MSISAAKAINSAFCSAVEPFIKASKKPSPILYEAIFSIMLSLADRQAAGLTALCFVKHDRTASLTSLSVNSDLPLGAASSSSSFG